MNLLKVSEHHYYRTLLWWLLYLVLVDFKLFEIFLVKILKNIQSLKNSNFKTSV